MAQDKYVYTKLNEIESSHLKEFNIYGIITDVFHKVSYDRRGQYQDEYRIKVNDGTTGDEDINVTAFAQLEKIPNDAFQKDKIARFHRLIKNPLKNGGFYLCGRIGSPASLLLFDLPTPGSRFKFNPSYRSTVNYSQSQTDEDIIADLISKANAIIGGDQVQAPTTSASPPPNTPALRRSPRKTPQKAATQQPKTQPPSATKTPTRQQKSHSQQLPTSSRRSSRLRGKSPEVSPIIEESSEEEDDDESVATASVAEEENAQQQQTKTPQVSAVSQRARQQQSHLNQVSPPENEREFFTKISYLVCGNSNYYNVLCQVVSCYNNGRGPSFLRVWDGTRNPRPARINIFDESNLNYGDLKKEKRIAADKKLYEVTCYGEHAGRAANLKPGVYIALVNMHFFIPKNCAQPSMVMHDGEGVIRTTEGSVSAARKVKKINAREHRTAYGHIDRLIKKHEPDLPILEEENVEADSHVQREIPSQEYNEFLGISPTSSPPKNPQLTVAPQRMSSQASTITISSDGSTQSCVLLSQMSPDRDVEVISSEVAGSSSQNHFYPKPQFSQTGPSTTKSTTFQRPITVPDATVPRIQPATTSTVFARRPKPISFDTTPPPTQQQPPEPKRSRLTQSPQKSQDSVSTQSVFDKLKAATDSENDSGSSQSQYQNAEYRRIQAITDSQLEDMWAAVENPNFYPSPPYF